MSLGFYDEIKIEILMFGIDRDPFKHTLGIFTFIHDFKYSGVIWPFTINLVSPDCR